MRSLAGRSRFAFFRLLVLGCIQSEPQCVHVVRRDDLYVVASRAVDTLTGLPIAWNVRTAKDSELPEVSKLLDAVTSRGYTFDVCVLDRGYDSESIYAEVESLHARPIIPLREIAAVKAGKAAPPNCDHRDWAFAGSDAMRGTSKWRCPTGECAPRSRWVKASRLHPFVRGTRTGSRRTTASVARSSASSAGSSTSSGFSRSVCGGLLASSSTLT
jgi:hypothetical protein